MSARLTSSPLKSGGFPRGREAPPIVIASTERPEITGRYHKGVLWSPSSFAASCGGAPLSVIAEYVKSQREAAQDRSRSSPA
ncbi:transposase [Rhizobium gallicum]|uniref:transposase n=1 Tax=Rhizobium gallicum TaxID=56730 RepID=UPI003B8A5DB3